MTHINRIYQIDLHDIALGVQQWHLQDEEVKDPVAVYSTKLDASEVAAGAGVLQDSWRTFSLLEV